MFFVDSDGTLYEILADHGQISNNPTMRTLDLFGSVSSLAVDGSGNLYVAGIGDIFKIGCSGLERDVYVADFAIFHPPSIGQLYKLDFADAPRLNLLPTTPSQTSSDSPQTVTIVNEGNENLIFSLPLYGTNPSISNQFTL